MKWHFSVTLIFGALGIIYVAPAPAHDVWPKAKVVSARYEVANATKPQPPGKDGFVLDIDNASGKPAYTLSCHSGWFNGEPEFSYSGLLDCRLVSLYSTEAVSTLLTDTSHQTSDWHNRGRFLAKHLALGCASYPDWGATRTFLLRNMQLTLHIENVRTLPNARDPTIPLIESYSVVVAVKPDPTANSSLAERSNVPEPPWFYNYNVPCKRS